MPEETRAAVRAMEMVERKDRVLIVEDEDNARKGYEQLLQRWGCDVVGVGTAEEALAKFASYQPDTLIADVELPGMNGLDLLKQLGTELHGVPAIIITGKGSEERAVAAIEAGAFWYIEKPLKGPVLRALLDRALGKARDARQLAVLQRQLRETGRLGDLVGASKHMQEVMRIVETAAPSSASVLITGETGSGKEIVARTLHKLSPRANGPFVAINCSAIPETLMESEIFGHERGAFTGAAERRIGCFELADGGTLLLDEIGEMPAPTQAKLLRVLERAAIMCEKDLITRSCLPGEFGKTGAKGPSDLSAIKFPVGTTVDAMERELILQTLGATGNNKTRAAELLGISLKTLHNKLKEYGGDRAEAE